MAQGQAISFTSGIDRTLYHNGGGWIFSVSGTPVTTIVDSGAIWVGASQVLGSRRTGWIAPTGTTNRGTFDTTTVTLPQLAGRFKALFEDLAAHGMIGA
jgi:hypothetical protein